MGIQPEGERKNDMRRPVFWGTDPILYFPGSAFYTQRRNTKVMQGQQSLLLLKSDALYKCIQRSYGCYIIFWPGGLLTIYDPLLVTVVSNQNTYLSRVIILKTDATFRRYQIKLHSHRVRVQWVLIKKRIYLVQGPTWLISRLILISLIC